MARLYEEFINIQSRWHVSSHDKVYLGSLIAAILTCLKTYIIRYSRLFA